jgi:hypothetical protein
MERPQQKLTREQAFIECEKLLAENEILVVYKLMMTMIVENSDQKQKTF